MSQAQLQELLAGVVAAARTQHQPTEGATTISQMPLCHLGRDKTKRYKAFEDWIKAAEAKMEYLRISESNKKVTYIKVMPVQS